MCAFHRSNSEKADDSIEKVKKYFQGELPADL